MHPYDAAVPNKPKTPNRVIRVDDELWHDYGEVCDDEGVTKSDDLRGHMQRKVKAYRRRQRDGSPNGSASAE